ncbi:endolysin [Thermoanaerobacterium phage THSA-485A]|uniref:endolysin n=1 Tax=Thermoanaerobacterium phage THSA-485A TaxID=1126885 RepID=UPI000263F830|nr:endolysin [Thermoanaerobacterium phage THSA-485A]AFK87692.1 glycoside hydrolase family 25 [Thermoanaerobacterium phage THSA-485A]
MIKIIDVSSNNTVTSTHEVKNAGYYGIICKATEGTSYVNPTFADVVNRTKAVGLKSGSYHFARPDVNSNAEQEAEHYYNVMKQFTFDLPPVLDIEVQGNMNKQQLTNWALTFLKRIEKLTGRKPWIYTGDYFYNNCLIPAQLKEYPLWIAAYGSTEPTTPHIMWQYTDSENVPGVGKCDVSLANDDFSIRTGGNSMLQRGSTGDAVKTLQQQLNQLGYNLVVDGVFGANTENAVKDFQSKHGLVVDGIVGPATQAAISNALQQLQPQPQPQPTTTYTIVFDDQNQANLVAQVLGGKVRQIQ